MFILVVREEGSERNNMPYLILLRMLGATVVGARSLEQARTKIESSTHAFVRSMGMLYSVEFGGLV